MAVTAERQIDIQFTEGLVAGFSLPAAANENAAAVEEIKTLNSGANTITVPTSGTVPTSVTIVPPADNTQSITLKGVTGDTGVRLHNTDPTSIALDSSVTTFCLTAGASITGVRFFWT